MKKNIVLTFGLLTFLFLFFSTSVEASEFDDSDLIEVPEAIEGTLISDEGEEVTIVGELIEPDSEISLFSLSDSANDSESNLVSNEASYEFSIMAADTSGTKTTTQTDNSVSAKVILKIHYTETITGIKKAVLTQVSGSYKRIDPTVRINGAILTYGSTGPTRSNPAYITQRRTQTVVPSNFSYRTFFNTKVTQLGGGAVGANLGLNISRGTGRSWSLKVSNNLF